MKKKYLIDYLSFTIFDDLKVYELLHELELNFPFKHLDRGNFGYENALSYNNILVFYDNKISSMGTHFQLSGKALSMLQGTIIFDNLFGNIKKFNYKISRIDLTLDVIDFDLLNKIKFNLALGNVKTRFKTFTTIEKKQVNTLESFGETIYFGSRTSNIFIRFYDKAKEKREKEKDITRIEIELKNKSATKIFNQLESHFLDRNLHLIINGLLKNNINFVDTTKDKNKSRCPVLQFWETVIDYDETTIVKSGISYEEKNITQKKEWLINVVSRSFAKVLYTDSQLIEELQSIGTEKLDEKDEQDIHNYNLEILKLEQRKQKR